MGVVSELKDLGESFEILYVEDDDTLRRSASQYLDKFFKHVDVARDGQEGLEMYNKKIYDIVISDISMPKISGLEMSEKIKKLNENQEIIIISGYSESKYFQDAIKMGINGYIIKPIEYDQLNSTLLKSVQKLTKFKENDLYKEHLEELVKQRSQKLVEAEKNKTENFKQTLLALVEMIEDRDTYTGGHSQRVANYCSLIACELGYSDEDCDLIYQAGILHDIGKIATPDAVLLKPGKLSEIEYDLIKEHVSVGYDLLHKVPMYKKLSDIMHYHHERYDGKGYPRGLRAKEIPPLARIMIVADAFDAMTTSRIYKTQKSVDEAMYEIKNLSGIQFDPDVVKAALGVFENLKEVEYISQIPVTQIEQERFSYFFKDQLTATYNTHYLDFILNNNHVDRNYFSANAIYLHNFGEYNKKFGWSEGDEILYKLASKLKKMYESALIFRIHGDDFVILSKDELNIEIDSINQLPFLSKNNLYCSKQNIKIDPDKLSNLRDLEVLLNE